MTVGRFPTLHTGYAAFFDAIASKFPANTAISAEESQMDPRCLYRPQDDDNRPGTSQEDPHNTQDSFKKKRKCRFSAEEQEILAKEVTEHQHQLFVT
ncbi:hypothetical protein NDU88_008214 [Pleurodeles waltl]|uniref:Uncharacterized protein n=1 Tax=Pleurodeles waltl TaxID=8319 RepID=A0AAV7PNI1_PLEWA|nr:hypothetical protein NDU88_008214 [Pleurodeles waltl]